jgi:hypothetical protein
MNIHLPEIALLVFAVSLLLFEFTSVYKKVQKSRAIMILMHLVVVIGFSVMLLSSSFKSQVSWVGFLLIIAYSVVKLIALLAGKNNAQHTP